MAKLERQGTGFKQVLKFVTMVEFQDGVPGCPEF